MMDPIHRDIPEGAFSILHRSISYKIGKIQAMRPKVAVILS
jgi:hypothetical protein